MNFIGKICPYCKSEFKENDDVVICSICEMPHHKDCWIENKACTTFGCTGTIMGTDNYTNSLFCQKCGSSYTDSEETCASCGSVLLNVLDHHSQNAYPLVQQHSLNSEQTQYTNYNYSQPQYNNYNQPNTNYNQPNSNYNQPNSNYNQPNTDYNQPNTDYNQPNTDYNQPNTDYNQPNSNYNQPNSNYNQPNSNYNQPNSNYNQPNSNYNQPNSNYNQPNSNYNQPNSNYNQPNSNYNQPNSNYNQPNSNYNQPNSNYNQPNSNYNQPNSNYNQPNSNYNQPNSNYNQPNSNYNQPNSNYNQPNSNYYNQPNTNYSSYGEIDVDIQAFVQRNQYYFLEIFRKFNRNNSKDSWNWTSSFLGGYWYGYRKMYLVQFLYYVILLLGMVIPLLNIALFVCSGIFGNYLYKCHAEKHVKIAKNMDPYMKQNYLMKKGGPSNGNVWAIIGIQIFIIIIFITVINPY